MPTASSLSANSENMKSSAKLGWGQTTTPNSTGTKRKAASPSPTDSDVEDTPKDQNGVLSLSPGEKAKRAFLECASQPVPKPMLATGGGGGNVSVEGVVLRVGKISVAGKKGSVPKVNLTVMVTKVIHPSSAPVVPLTTAAAFCLPTKTEEATPEAIAKDPNAKGATVIDLETGINSVIKANFLNQITCSFYTDTAGGKPGKGGAGGGGGGGGGDKDASSIENVSVGSKVLISNVTCSFGKDRQVLYTNAKKATMLRASNVASADIIQELRGSNSQETSALMLAMTLHGFHGYPTGNSAQEAQAEACRSAWKQSMEGITAKLKSLANGATAEKTQEALQKLVHGAQEVSAESASAGAIPLPVDIHKDCTSPYSAVLLQTGVSPEMQVPDAVLSLFDKVSAAGLPSSFVSAQVASVDFRGALVQVSYLLRFVFDKQAALEAIDEGMDPVLSSNTPAASTKFSKRSIGPELVGSLTNSKIEIALTEVLPYADQAVVTSVFPRDATDMLDGHFGSSSGIDFASGIERAAIAVSKEWLNSNMLSGRGVHIYSSPTDEEVFEPATGATPSPTLARSRYVALSEESFELDELKAPDGKEIKFFVVYDGCAKDVKANASINTNVEAGEEHIAQVVAAKETEVKEFLKKSTVVYAIAF